MQGFSTTNVLTEHKEHSAVSVRLENRTNEFEIGFKQIQVSFKIYSNLQYFLTSAESYEGSCAKKYQNHILSSFAYKLVYVDDKFSKTTVFCRGESNAYKFIEEILEEYEYCKKVVKRHFNKNLIMT